MTDLRYSARQLAARGRFGDSMLLHVHPLEVAGIASLVPGGRLTINPETGLPEAFFFLPFLASLFGAAAPAAAAGAAAAGTAALGAGTAAAATGALGAGLSAGTTAALGAGAAGAGTLAAAAPAITAGIGSLAPTAAGLGAAAAPLAAPAAIAPAATGALTGGAGINSLLGAAGTDVLAAAPAAASPIAQVAPLASSLSPGTAGVSSLLPPAPAAGGFAAPGGTGTFAVPSLGTATPVTPAPAAAATAPATTRAVTPATTTTGLKLGEVPANVGANVTNPIAASNLPLETSVVPTARPGTGLDGLMKYMDMKYIMPAYLGMQMLKGMMPAKKKSDDEDEKEGKAIAKSTYQGGEPVFPERGYDAGSSGEWNYFTKPTQFYANGGIVSLANGGPVDPQQQMPQDMQFPMNGGGIGSLAAPVGELPTSDFPTSQVGAVPEPPAGADEVAAPTDDDKELIMQTVEAIQGKVQDPNPILLAFIKEFGEQAFQDLVMRVKQMPQQAQGGDGQSDSIPALIDGQQPAALSQDEFVIPSDVVSGLGNGSTSAGAKQLSSMVDNVRQTRTGSPAQPKPVNPAAVVPGYKKGGLVKKRSRMRPYIEVTEYPPMDAGGDHSFIYGPQMIPRSAEITHQVPYEVGPAVVAHRQVMPGYVDPGSGGPPAKVADPYANESILPEWMDRYIPSVRAIAAAGNPFGTEQEINSELKRRGMYANGGRVRRYDDGGLVEFMYSDMPREARTRHRAPYSDYEEVPGISIDLAERSRMRDIWESLQGEDYRDAPREARTRHRPRYEE